jgi:hypothetical protein
MAHCRLQASFTDSFEEIFPSRLIFITKPGPQVNLSPVPYFGVNTDSWHNRHKVVYWFGPPESNTLRPVSGISGVLMLRLFVVGGTNWSGGGNGAQIPSTSGSSSMKAYVHSECELLVDQPL